MDLINGFHPWAISNWYQLGFSCVDHTQTPASAKEKAPPLSAQVQQATPDELQASLLAEWCWRLMGGVGPAAVARGSTDVSRRVPSVCSDGAWIHVRQ